MESMWSILQGKMSFKVLMHFKFIQIDFDTKIMYIKIVLKNILYSG